MALDYATGAANMSYEDTQGWLTRLTDNTTPELSAKLRNAASQMEQLLRPSGCRRPRRRSPRRSNRWTAMSTRWTPSFRS